jgi:hypothetical protein
MGKTRGLKLGMIIFNSNALAWLHTQMMDQPFYNNQVFRDSGCLRREHALISLIEDMLRDCGYQTDSQHVWYLDQIRVILAIVDDIEHVNYAHSEDFLGDLSPNDIVITDAWPNRPLNCRLILLPNSWFGIYAHQPKIQHDVTHPFVLPINRIDYNRAFLAIRMCFDQVLHKGLVNFNCVDRTQGPEQDLDQRRHRWQQFSADVVEWYGDKYQRSRDDLCGVMPLRNHELDHDSACQRGALQVVVETYCSDYTVCLSEKIFQALCLPRPWIVLAGTWTVARLRQLGFDVLDDMIDHSYDRERMNDDKIVHLSGLTRAWAEQFTLEDWPQLEPRCQQAADHNRHRLLELRRDWAQDQANVLARIAATIQPRPASQLPSNTIPE